MKRNEKCKLCGSDDLEVVFEAQDRLLKLNVEKFTLAKCRRCGLVCTLPYVTEDEAGKYYPDNYYGDSVINVGHGRGKTRLLLSAYYSKLIWRGLKGIEYPLSRRAADLISGLFLSPLYKWRNLCFPYEERPGRFLDIGCGSGQLLAEERALGWDVRGVELNGKSAAYAREKMGLDVLSGYFDNAGFEDSSFDIVSLQHVMEHFIDPVAELTKIRRILRPGGILAVRIPNLSRTERAVFGSSWGAYDIPRHRFHFERTTVRKMLEKAGFDILRIVWVLNVNNMILSIKNILEDRSASGRVIAFFSVNNKILRAILLPLAALLKLFGDSGEMLIYAEKRAE